VIYFQSDKFKIQTNDNGDTGSQRNFTGIFLFLLFNCFIKSERYNI
jgi:hypothetical protein